MISANKAVKVLKNLVTANTLRNWAKQGKLPYITVGAKMLFAESDINSLITVNKGIPTSNESDRTIE